MGLFDNFKKIINRITKKDDTPKIEEVKNESLNPKPEEQYIPIEFPKDELVSFLDGEEVLDSDSKAAVEKLKHNLEVLIKRTKEAGKVERFMLIREDDFFPHGWKWDVLSKNTNLESESTPLSYELRKAYALREAGLDRTTELMGIKVPVAQEEQMQALRKVDKKIGNFLLPSRFRSTKHFTVNTPLEITGNYNFVSTDRDFIIMDDISNFLKSGYGYSAAYHDAYLDVSHEGLPISENAIVLINDKNYDRIMSDPKTANELAQRRVVRYKGETFLAINMMLTEMGALPSTIGTRYANYDMQTRDIVDRSIRDLAQENGLFFDRSHAGTGEKGHFSNYFDDKNSDYQKAVRESIEFLISKFPEQKNLLETYLIRPSLATSIVENIGIDELLSAINEYNNQTKERFSQSLEQHNQEQSKITPRIHEQFTGMVSLINEYYKDIPFDSNYEGKREIESAIQTFFQGDTLQEKQEAGKIVWEQLRPRITERVAEQSERANSDNSTQQTPKTDTFENR